MSDAERVLPLFPLGTVLFPGLVLPLHVFEERYRELVRTLLARPPAERIFGVVAIRRGQLGGAGGPDRLGGAGGPDRIGGGARPGREAGHSAVDRFAGSAGSAGSAAHPDPSAADPSPPDLSAVDFYEVGCTAEIRDVTKHPDGTYDLVTVGRQRFAIRELIEAPTPYRQAAITFLPEQPGPEGAAEALGPRVLAAFRAYLRAYRSGAAGQEQLPEDPLVLSHLVAATAALTLAERQALLAAADTATRLREALRLLQRETALVSRVRAVPASLADLAVRPGPN